MDLTFEWDREKAAGNQRVHGVSFDEAETVFGDPLSVSIADPIHSVGERRSVLLGLSRAGRHVVVIYTEHRGIIRIINARVATRLERRSYEEGYAKNG